MNSFRRADVNTGLAVNTQILVNFCFFIVHCYCRCGTFIHAGFTTSTLFFVNDCNQKGSLQRICITNYKKRVSILQRLFFSKVQDFIHAINAGLFTQYPPCGDECPARKDGAIIGAVGEGDGLKVPGE